MVPIRKILNSLGLLYDPSSAIPTPFSSEDPKPKKKKVKGPELTYFQGRPFEQTELTQDSLEFKRYTGQKTGISKELLPDEREAILEASLDTDKAARIKPHLAAGLSAKKTSEQFKGVYGYGIRTIETYYSLLNRLQGQK